jgi:adenine-specific DNA-methyltransferase
VERPRFLLDCRLPEPEIKKRYPLLWRYLESGVERGVADAYLSRHRSPWYAQERRAAAPLLCADLQFAAHEQSLPPSP